MSFEKLVLRGICVIVHLLANKGVQAYADASKFLKDAEAWLQER